MPSNDTRKKGKAVSLHRHAGGFAPLIAIESMGTKKTVAAVTKPLCQNTASVGSITLPTVSLSGEEIELARTHAQLCSLGGRSQVRGRASRDASLSEDQLTGQVCELAFSKYWFGSTTQYQQSRWTRNNNPRVGDGGFDFPGFAMNVKGSLRRDPNRPFEKYHLLIRPAERKQGMTYIQAVADLTNDPLVVFLGFLADEEITGPVDEGWHFKGAHAIPFSQLHRLPPYPWHW
jgi:hypothetical protein